MPRVSKGRKPKEPQVVRCYHCNYETKIKSNLKKHIVNVHVLRRGTPRERFFTCPMCQFVTIRSKMMDHYSYEHNVSISKSCHNFSNLDDFRAWKSKVEKDEASRYVVLKGVSKLKTCHVWYYRCHRDGFFNSKGTGKRNIKVKGTNKINGCCPSEMKVMEDKATGKVQVHFVKTHFGHSQDLNRLPLLKEDKDRIAEKLARKIPLSKVLDEIQNSKAGDQLERIHLVTRKDVLNIASSYKLKNDCVRRSLEGFCSEIDDWVKEVEQEVGVVRFYKAQGELSTKYPELTTADFVLIVFNDIQVEYLKFYGCHVICIDRTHPSTRGQHDIELTTLSVTDGLRQGFPCAFMMSNRSDIETTSVFIKVVSSYLKCPITCDTFMSDVADFYFDAWCNSMPVPPRRIFSTWHVERAWKRLLMKIKNADKRAFAYKIIKSLVLERDMPNFEQALETSIKELKSDPEMLPFAESFEEEYCNNYSCWAMQFRVNSDNLNSAHLETMHKSIKHLFFQGKKLKRLDKSIWDAMKVVRDRVFDQSIKSYKGVLPACLVDTTKRHAACMNALRTDVVIEKTEGTVSHAWKVHCGSQVHDVVEQNAVCPCSLRCEDCRICVHSYRCSCYVGTLEWFICDHVHFLASSLSEVTRVEIEVKHIEEALPVHVQVHHIPQPQVHVPHHVVQEVNQVEHPQRLQVVPQLVHVPQQVQVPVTRLLQPMAQIQQTQVLHTQLVQHTSQHVQHHHQHTQMQHTQQTQHAMEAQNSSTQVQLTQPVQHGSPHISQQVHHNSQQVQHSPQQSQHSLQQVQHSPQQSQHSLQQVQHSPQQSQHSLQQVQHPQRIHPQPVHSQAQHVSSQTVSGSDDDDDRSMEVLHICETNVAREIEDLILKQFTKTKQERDSELGQAKNEALKLVQDIFDAVETKAQLDIFTNAISPVLPTITAMKYSACTYK